MHTCNAPCYLDLAHVTALSFQFLYCFFFLCVSHRIVCSMLTLVIGQPDDTKICVVMVGLPARGKSLIAGKGTAETIR